MTNDDVATTATTAVPRRQGSWENFIAPSLDALHIKLAQTENIPQTSVRSSRRDGHWRIRHSLLAPSPAIRLDPERMRNATNYVKKIVFTHYTHTHTTPSPPTFTVRTSLS